MQRTIPSAALAALLSASALTAQTVNEIPAMTVPLPVAIDFDNVNGGTAGPVTVAQIQAGGVPTAAVFNNITLTPSTAAAGAYNTNPQGLGLGLGPSGGLELIPDTNAPFTAFDAQIDLQFPSTEFGLNVGDWVGPMILDFYLGGALQTSFTTTTNFNVGIGPVFLQMTGGQFDRVDVRASTTAGNWVFTELHFENPPTGQFPSFSSNVTSGPAPLTVNFTDTSYTSDPAGVIAWLWDIDNDGNIDYQTQNPTHTYTACGTYDVALQIVDAQFGLSAPVVRTGYIEVGPISADFTWVNNAGTIQFTDTSTNATTWAWDFENDGTVDSTAQNPQHTYPGPGIYSCSLTVGNGCNNATTTSQVVTITPLCTTLAGGNGLSGTAGCYFDVNVTNPNGITIVALDVSAFAAATGNVDVWTIPNTYVGNETNAAAWTLVSQATNVTVTGGAGTLDFVDVPDFVLATGSHGLYITTAGGASYTNGNGTNQTVSNADMTLTLGASSTNFGAPFTPRVWNGCIYYDTSANGTYTFHRAGCAGTAGAVTTNVAQAGSSPRINTTLSVDLSPLPASNTAIMIFGIDDQVWNGNPLPLSGQPFGAPGCFLNIAPESTSLVVGAGGTGTWNLTIPNNPAFIGTPFFTQALVIDPAANGLGGVASDSARGVVGQ